MTNPPPNSPGDNEDREDRDLRPTPMRRVADTDRQILQAATLRRRQLRSALLYGSTRTWRQKLSLWPAALVGGIAIALIVAAIAVTSAFQQEQERKKQEEKEREQEQQSAVVIVDDEAAYPGIGGLTG